MWVQSNMLKYSGCGTCTSTIWLMTLTLVQGTRYTGYTGPFYCHWSALRVDLWLCKLAAPFSDLMEFSHLEVM